MLSDRDGGNVSFDPSRLELDWKTERDIPFVMEAERLAGNEALIGRWDEAQHRNALSDPRCAYFLARLGSKQIGFAIEPVSVNFEPSLQLTTRILEIADQRLAPEIAPKTHKIRR
jgi:hypothetical protein